MGGQRSGDGMVRRSAAPGSNPNPGASRRAAISSLLAAPMLMWAVGLGSRAEAGLLVEATQYGYGYTAYDTSVYHNFGTGSTWSALDALEIVVDEYRGSNPDFTVTLTASGRSTILLRNPRITEIRPGISGSSESVHRLRFEAPAGALLAPDTTYTLTLSGKNGTEFIVQQGSFSASTSLPGWTVQNFVGQGFLGPPASTPLKIFGNVLRDSDPPFITDAPVITSRGSVAGDYATGEAIKVRLRFSEDVEVSGGVPVVPLQIGPGAMRNAGYVAGESTARDLVFSYTVQAVDRDDDGIRINASTLTRNGSAIRRSGTDVDANLGHPGLTNQAGHRVNSFPRAPTITNVAVTSTPETGDTYGLGEEIQITVTFSEAVEVSDPGPGFVFSLGASGDISRKTPASYKSGSGTTALLFAYTVQVGDYDDNGIWIGDNSDTLNLQTGQSIRSVATQAAASLVHGRRGAQPDHKVDSGSRSPKITNVAVTSTPQTGDTYGLGEEIQFTVTFSGNVVVSTPAPSFVFSLGSSGAARRAAAPYKEGSGTTALIFAYTVKAGDVDDNGIWIGESPSDTLALQPGQFIRSDATTQDPALLLYNRLETQTDHKIDSGSGPPTITNVAVTSTPGTYGLGDDIEITVTFSEAVEVSSPAPSFVFSLSPSSGVGKRAAAPYKEGSGTTALLFAYTVQSGDYDDNGIWIGNNSDTLNLEMGQYIRSVATQVPATLIHDHQGPQRTHMVDTYSPLITVSAGNVLPESSSVRFTLARTGDDMSPALDVNIEISETGDMIAADNEGERTVRFAAGQLTVTVQVAVDNDEVAEDDSTVEVRVAPPFEHYRLGNPSTATVMIHDDDKVPDIKIIASRNRMNEGSSVTFTLERSGDTRLPLTVTVRVSETGDVVAADNKGERRVRFAARSRTATLQVPTVNDSKEEADSIVSVDVIPGPGYAPGLVPYADVQVVDSDVDAIPVVSLEVTDPEALPTEGDTLNFTLNRTGDTTNALTVDVAVAESGDMVASSDKGSRQVTIAAGQADVTFTIPTVADTADEDDSVVTARVAADDATPATYEVGAESQVVVTVADDDDAQNTLVSNIDQSGTSGFTLNLPIRQRFTTGAHADGYTLSGVDVVSRNSTAFDVVVCGPDSFSTTSNFAGDSNCTVLSRPDTFAAGTLAFTASPAMQLDANTSYVVVFDGMGSQISIGTTTSTDEDTGAATGWSLKDTGARSQVAFWGDLGNIVFRIAIKGDENSNTAPTVANTIGNQTAATGTEFTFTVPDNTFDDADGDTLTYTATLSDASPLPDWLSFAADTRTFTGTPTTAETLTIRVTANDGIATVHDDFDMVVSTRRVAPTVTTLVSNVGQSSTSSLNTTRKRAQRFTTGSHAAGYNLSSVDIVNSASLSFSLSVCETGSDGFPTSTCHNLTAPATFVAGTATFTAPANTILAANTTYAVVVTPSTRSGMGLAQTLSPNEDGGAAAGWSIRNTRDSLFSGEWRSDSTNGLKIAIKGYDDDSNAAPTVANRIADQTATTGTEFTFTVPDNTFDDADGDTLTYTAALANSNPLPAWLSFNAASRTFRGRPPTVETLTVRVTASDGAKSVHADFDIVVSEQACAAPDLTRRRRIWTGNMAVGEWEASGVVLGHGYVALNNVGALDDTDFELLGNNSYAVDFAVVYRSAAVAGDLLFSLTSDLSATEVAALRLHVCDTAYDFSAADHDPSGNSYSWNLNLDWSTVDTRTLVLSLPSNPAEGAPVVSGVAEANQTLTADTSAVTDADGLPDTLHLQWFRENEDGTNREAIPGATSSSYTLVNADVGKRVGVRLAFTDLLGGEEAVESAPFPASGTVGAPEGSTACPAPDFSNQRYLWTGNVTVEDYGFRPEFRIGHGFWVNNDVGDLDDRDFDIGANSYTISQIYVTVSGGDLSFRMTSSFAEAELAALRLHVCDTPYDFSNATPGDDNFYYWDTSLDWSSESTRTLHLSLPANRPATGTPTISSSDAANLGDELTVDTSAVMDADGLPGTLPLQWFREDEDGTNREDIPGQTSETYRLTVADLGKKVGVRLAFTDLLNSPEVVESAPFPASGTVSAPGSDTCPAPDFGNRRYLWTGNVTVEVYRFNPAVIIGHGFWVNNDVGALDDRDFDIGANSYIISQIYVSNFGGDLSFRMTSSFTEAELAALRLHVCDTPYDFSNATPEDDNFYYWDTSLDWSSESTRTLHLSLPANRPATGTPTLSRSDVPSEETSAAIDVGDVLSVDTSAVMDADGLTDTFTYQWVREDEDGTNREPIPGATSDTYTLTVADVGRKVRVQVSFTDLLHNQETVESAPFPASGTVTGLPKITIEANRTTAPAFVGLINYTLTRQGDTADALNGVRIILSGPAGHDWGSLTCPSSNPCEVDFAAGSATATLASDRRLGRGYFGIGFTGAGTVAGDLTASIQAVSGYDTSDTAKIGIVVPPAGQQVFQVGFSETDYEVMEGGGPYTITLEAVANFTGATLPIFTMGIAPITVTGTATSPEDYGVLSIATQIGSSDCAVNSDDFLVCMVTVQLNIVDDSVAEPTENFRLQVQSAPGLEFRAANFASPVTVTLRDNDPGLLGVNVTSTPLQAGNTYGAREHIEFTARFNTPVEVSGVPTFTFDMGGTDVAATYFRGSGTDTLVFSHAVRGGNSGDEDTDGISWGANAFTGTINVAGTSDPALLVHRAQSALSSHKVDGPDSTNRADTATVTDITVSSTPRLKSASSVTTPDTYGEGEDIEITVTFSAAVAVEGDPRFRFSLADSSGTNNVDAVYDRGSGTTRLVFVYTVQAADSDDDGIEIGEYGGGNRDTFQLASDDRIRRADNNVDVSFSHSEEGTQTGHKVDGSMNANICDAPDFGERRQIWTGVVTVASGFPNTGNGGLNGFIIATTPGNSDAGDLNYRDFSIGGSTYTIDSIFVRDGGSLDGNLDFSLTSNLTDGDRAALRLHVCDTPYDFSDALRRTATNSYYWSPDLDWSGVEERTLYLSLPANSAPTVANRIAEQTATVGQTFSFAFPTNTFTDVDGDPLSYSATLDDGNALPSWLTFDATSRSFSGTPQAGDGGVITVRVTASDGTATVDNDFRIRVGTTCPAPSLGSRRQIWTGTVTVGANGSEVAVVFSRGYLAASVTGESNDVGALDDKDFTIGERTYTIDQVDVWNQDDHDKGNLRFSFLDRGLIYLQEEDALQLHVCDTAYAFADSDFIGGEDGSEHTHIWSRDLDWSGESTRTLYLSLPENNDATGTPTITSSAGDVLTASQSTMADSDGLPPTTFPEGYTFQWLREEENGSNQQPISGQNAQTYTLTDDDVGKKVRVQVSFTDRLGTMETLTSDAFPPSGTVISISSPLVSLSGPSSAVDEGSDLTFTFTLNKAASTDLTVGVAISETGDVVAPAEEGSQTVTIAAGDTQATFTIATDDDDDDEANSEVTVAVVADSASPATYGVGSSSAVMVTVEDNDLPRLRLVGLSQTTYDEGQTVRFGLTREGDLSSQLVVPVTVSGGENMIAGPPPSSVTFAVDSDTATLNISTVDDDVDEEDSEISVTVSADAAVYRLVNTTNDPIAQETTSATVRDDDTRGVRVSGSPLVVNEGDTGVYGVELESQPTEEVSITLSPPGNEDVSVSPTTLTFTAVNWDTPQTVTVTGIDDADSVDETVTISHDVSGYGSISVGAVVTISVTDSDTDGVRVTPTSGDLNEDGTLTYTVTLNTQPGGNVTITPTNGDTSAVSVSPARLTFTPSNWNTAQTVTLTGVEDADGVSETVTISHDVSGYGSVSLGAVVTISVMDSDTDGVSVTPTSGDLNEGGMASYTVKLDTQPSTNVTITPTNGDTSAVSVSPARLTFTPSNWNTTQTVTLSGVNDDDGTDETVTISHDVSGYGSVSVGAIVTISVMDNDTDGVSVTPTSVDLNEDGMVTYTVKLDTQPSANVTITPTNGDTSALAVSPARLTFTPSNWNTAQTVTLTGVDDDNSVNETVTIRHDVSGYGSISVGAVVTISVMDNDTDGVSVTPTSVDLNEDGMVTYTVKLDTLPNGPVTITPTNGDTSAVSVSPARLTFTTSNWNTTQTVTLTGVDDDDGANETVTISHSVSGYGSISVGAVVTISVMDSDTDGVRVTPTSGDLNEDGTLSYTVTLNTQPGGNVTITPSNGDTSAVSVSPASLTFTPSNWNTSQTVTLTGVNDADGVSETVTISHDVSGYGSISVGAVVTISVMDNDTDGVSVTPTSGDLNEGGTASYTVTLDTQPSANVTITPSNGDTSAVSVSPARLTFTPSNWNTAQTVTLTGVEDADGTDETVTISHDVSGYGSISVGAVVTISVMDNDTDGVRVDPTNLGPVEGETAVTYTVTLDTLPNGPVTITPSNGDTSAVNVSPASLTITPSNWDTPRTVSVTAVQDDDSDAETVTISHSVSGYGAVSVGAVVTVSVTDDDTPGVGVQPPGVNTDEGETAIYTMKLITQPTGNVTVAATSGDSGALSVSPARLTFTLSNWNVPQTVTVTGVEDDDGTDETVTVSHSVSGYGAVTAAPAATVTVTDNDTAGVSVSIDTLTVSEASSGGYTLQLSTLPSGAVTITPTSGDGGAVNVSPASLVFTTANWDTAQTVTVTAVDDDNIINETVTISHSVSGYDGVGSAAAVTVYVDDITPPTVTLSGPSSAVSEGDDLTFTLTLNGAASADLTVDVTVSETGDMVAATAEGSRQVTVVQGQTEATFTVATENDNVDETDSTVTATVMADSATPVTYQVGSAAEVMVTVTDNDTAGVSVSTATLTVSEDSTGVYTLELNTQPSANVTITPTSGDSDAVSVSPASLVFTTANWDTARTVTLTGVDDDDTDNETVAISHSVSGYGAITAAAAVTVIVDDTTPPTATLSGPSSAVSEGSDLTFTLTLDVAEPTDLTVGITVSETGDMVAEANGGSRTVTVAQGQTQATFTVATQNDDVDEADSVVTATVVADSADPATYQVGSGAEATVTDNDTRGVTVTAPSPVMALEEGTATYTLALTSQPTADVTIIPTSSDSGAVSVSPASLTFTADNWNTARTVTLMGVDDADDADETVTISHSVSGYGSVSIGAVVTISVTDNDTAGVSITPTDSELNLNEGGTATYTAKLDTLPSGNVTIIPSSGDTSAVSVSSASLTFTPSNWDTAQTVTLTGVEDVDGISETVTISHSVSGYGSVTADAVTVSVADNDVAGVRVEPAGSVDLVEGETVTYTVKLNTQPSGAVTIIPSSGDSDAVSVSPASLTFTADNWNTARTVTLTGVDDDDATDETVTISHSVSGYNGVTAAAAVTVIVDDITPPTVTLSGPSSAVSEGDDLTFTLTLDVAAPTDLTVDVTVSETGDMVAATAEGSRQVTVAQGQMQATFTVTTENDNVDETDSTVTATVMADSATPVTYQVGSAAEVMVTVTDNDTAGVSVSTATLTVSEDSTGVYTLELNTQPSANVTITPTGGDSAALTVSPASLTFTASNWDTARTVTVTAVDDDNTINETVTISHSVSGYDAITTAAAVTVRVNDTTPPTVTLSGPSPAVSEGSDLTFTLTLDAAAPRDLTVGVTVSETGDMVAEANGGSRTVTVAQGQTQATFTVATQNDDVDEADSVVTATVVTDNADPATYQVGSAAEVTVTVTDNDTRGVTVTAASPVMALEESTATYTLALTSQPTADVTIIPTSSDSGAVSVSPASLVFTTANWDTPQTVTLTGVDDADGANETVTISHSVSGYGSVTADAVTVSVTDNDVAGVSITPTDLDLNLNEGGMATYTMKLDTLPNGPVTITPTSDDSDAVSVSPASLVFTTANWDTPQTLTLTGVEDADDVNETVTISHSVSGYGSVTADAVTVSVMDNDVAGVRVEPAGSVDLIEGETATYTVTLNTQPSGAVTITPTSGDSDAVSVSPASLVFTTANWDTARTVTVTALDDDNIINETVTISHSVSGYDGVGSAAAVTVRVDDTTPPTVTLSGPSSAVREGDDLTFTLTLNGAAPTELTVEVTVSETGDMVAEANGGSRQVTVAQGQMEATFTVATENDNIDETDSVVTATVMADSATPVTYQVGSAAEVMASVTDNDVAGVSVSTATLTVNEDSSGFYTLALNTQPSTNVTITPSGGGTALAVSPTSLVFTTANWDTAQTVTVTGVDDDDTDNETVTISHGISGYGAITAAAAVTVIVDDTTPPTVTLSGLSSAVSEGDDLTFTLTLDIAAPTELTVDVTVSETGDVVAEASEGSRQVTVAQGQTEAHFTVATENDNVDEADSVVTAMVVTDSADPATYQVGSGAAVMVTIEDNDTRGVTVTGSPMTVNRGGTGIYGVMLTSQPTGDVTITTSSDNTDVAVSPATLTFTPANWNTGQMVTVTGAQDDDGMDDHAVIMHTVTGADYGDNSVTAGSVAVTVSEVVLPVVSIAADGPSVAEGGAAAFMLTRTGDTTDELTVAVVVSGTGDVLSGVAPTSVTFEAGMSMAALAVLTQDNNVDETDRMVTATVVADGDDPATYVMGLPLAVLVTVTDNDTRSVTLSGTTLSVDEGSTVTYTVVLTSHPTGDVTITPSSDNSGVAVSPATLTFTPANWNMGQTVTVTGAQDDDVMDDNAVIVHTVAGADYGDNGVTAADTVTVTVSDNEVPGVSMQPAILGADEGETATCTVQLITQPASNVTVTFINGDSGALTLSPAILTFTPSNWNTPQTVMMTGVEDDDANDEMVAISHRVSSTGAVSVGGAVTISVTDNDTAGVSVSPVSVNPVEGGMATYILVLDTRPAVPVTITPNSGDSDALAVSPASLTFTASNWDTAQTVSVMGVEDADTTHETVTIHHSVSSTGAVTAATAVTVTVTDDDTTQDEPEEPGTAKEEAEVVLDEVVLPDVMQQLTAQTTEVITSRLNSIASGSTNAPVAISLEEVLADTVALFHDQRDHLKNGSLEWRQALSGRDFAFPLSGLSLTQGEGASPQEGPFSSLAVWGGADYSSYGNIIADTDVDGNGFSGVIGMDMQPTPQLVTGLALTTSRWGLDYTTDTTDTRAEGTYEMGVTTVNPYVNWLATDQLSLWGSFGYGRGEVKQNPEGAATTTRSDGLTSWAGGVRFEVVPGADPHTGDGSPFGLAIKGDGAASSFLETSVQLVRLAAEVSRTFTIESGRLTAALDMGWSIRSVSGKDNLDAQQQAIADEKDGGGAELASRLHWLNADGSLSATVDTRVLLGGGHHREWGIGGHLRFTPLRQAGEGEGLSLTLQPSLGVTGTRLDELWSLSGAGELAISNDPPGARLDAKLAYGFPLGNGLLTPYTEVVWEDATSTWGAGLRYGLPPSSLELDLKGVHHSGANGNDENRLLLEVRSHL